MEFRFANPLAFQLLWALPLVIAAGIYLNKQSRLKIENALGKKLTPFLTSSVSLIRRRWKFVLESLVIFFFVLALARLQAGHSEGEIKSEGVEMIFAVDVSQSMLAEDVRPSRLEFAKKELSKLLDRLGGDKVGVVAFAGSAALVAPMSTDKAALKMFIESLDTNSVSAQGTEFRRALAEADSAFERGGADTDEETRVTRVVIVASDGEDNEPGALDMAEKLKDKGIRIFGLAFGTEKGAPIPVRDSRGVVRGYKKDRQGKVVLSQTKGTVLRKISEKGGGSFYHATFGADIAGALARDIGRLEKSEFESQRVKNYSERYQIFLLIALLLALIEIFISERSKGRRLWKGRFEAHGN